MKRLKKLKEKKLKIRNTKRDRRYISIPNILMVTNTTIRILKQYSYNVQMTIKLGKTLGGS